MNGRVQAACFYGMLKPGWKDLLERVKVKHNSVIDSENVSGMQISCWRVQWNFSIPFCVCLFLRLNVYLSLCLCLSLCMSVRFSLFVFRSVSVRVDAPPPLLPPLTLLIIYVFLFSWRFSLPSAMSPSVMILVKLQNNRTVLGIRY